MARVAVWVHLPFNLPNSPGIEITDVDASHKLDVVRLVSTDHTIDYAQEWFHPGAPHADKSEWTTEQEWLWITIA